MDNGFASHPNFKLPRVPAGRYITVHLRPCEKKELYEGIFETSGCEGMGTDNELYILRRVKAPREPAEFLRVPRRWQESGHLKVFELRRDERYLPSETST